MVRLINNVLFVDLSYLKDKDISFKTIEKWSKATVTKVGKGADSSYQYDTIPAQTRAKLPTENELLAMYYSEQKAAIVDAIYKKLLFAQSRNSNYYQNIYRKQYGVEIKKALQMAMRAAVWQRLLELHTEYSTGGKGGLQKGMAEALLKAYLMLYPGAYMDASFSRAVKAAKEKGVTEFCYDGRIDSNRLKHNKKYDERHIAILYSFFAPGKGYKSPYILKQMQHACKKLNIDCPKGTWVKENMAKLELNPEVFLTRYGKMEVDKVLPYVSLLPAEYAGDQYQLDGFVMPFLFQGKGKGGEIRYKRPIFNAVFDNHSKKIVGYSITLSEDRDSILEALEDAVKNTGGLPLELVSDNHSANKTNEIGNFKEAIAAFNVTWTVTSNPRQKLTAESSFKYISETICKNQPGYLGLGIKTKSKGARPSQEQIDKYLKADHRLSFDEIKAIGVLIAETWNNQLAPGRNNTPNKLFAASQRPNLRVIDDIDRMRLFTKTTEYTITNCQITMRVSGRKEYLLPAKFAHLNRKKVVVRYIDFDEIYLFEPTTDHFICTLKPKKAAHGALANQTPEDIEILNQQTALTKSVKATGRKQIEDILFTADEMEPGILDLLNDMTTPKDVRQLAMENADYAMALRVKGIEVNRMPINKKTSDLDYPAFKEPARNRKQNSPYHNPNHVITEINLDE